MRVVVPVVLVVLVAAAACDDDPGPSTCTPDGYWIWPADCEVAVCGNLICDATCPAGQTCPRLDCTQSPQCRI
ncbi:MAG TPA: hypothetical protein VLB44_14535, partial [Kofleriaceae bacterium]|nr:hypothetical protein [Kofleriaceae bacterium]